MSDDKARGHRLPKTRDGWREIASDGDFFENMPEWYRDKVDSHIPKAYDRDWIVAIYCPDHTNNTLLGYIYPDGIMVTVGCYHCLNDDEHRIDSDGQPLVGGLPAVPLQEVINAEDLPEGMQLFEIAHMRLFICPCCGHLMKKWSRAITDDPTLGMNPKDRERFLDRYVRNG